MVARGEQTGLTGARAGGYSALIAGRGVVPCLVGASRAAVTGCLADLRQLEETALLDQPRLIGFVHVRQHGLGMISSLLS